MVEGNGRAKVAVVPSTPPPLQLVARQPQPLLPLRHPRRPKNRVPPRTRVKGRRSRMHRWVEVRLIRRIRRSRTLLTTSSRPRLRPLQLRLPPRQRPPRFRPPPFVRPNSVPLRLLRLSARTKTHRHLETTITTSPPRSPPALLTTASTQVPSNWMYRTLRPGRAICRGNSKFASEMIRL